MRKPLNARSTKFVKIQTSARATLGANPASSASRHPHPPTFPSGPRCEPVHSVWCASGKARYSFTFRREIVLSVGWFGSSARQMALWSPCRQGRRTYARRAMAPGLAVA